MSAHFMLGDFSSVGFSGSRSLAGQPWRHCFSLAAAAAAAGCAVSSGCAAGADRAARCGAPGGRVFSAAAFTIPGKPFAIALARRSTAFVQALAESFAPLLVSFPGAACPARLVPGRSWRSGFGSGSWQSLALAVGLGTPVVVFLPACMSPPPSWGVWSLAAAGPFVGSWSLRPAQPALPF